MKTYRQILFRALPILLLLCAAIVFYRDCTVRGGGDFLVYWQVAKRVLGGGPNYLPSVDIPNAYRYPPWSLPLFLPLAAGTFEFARVVWALISVAAMFAAIAWIAKKAHCSLWSIVVSLIFTWGIWGSEFNHGQVCVPMLAGLLWFWDKDLPQSSRWRAVGLLFIASIKVFTAFPVFYFWNRFREGLSKNPGPWVRALALTVGLFAVLSIPSLIGAGSPHFRNLLGSWYEVGHSVMAGFGPDFVRGRSNQGLPVVVGRIVDIHSVSDRVDLMAFVVISILIGLWWNRVSKRLTPEESWAGWVAWICVIDPLSWSRNFVLALPLLALSVDRAWRSGRRDLMALVTLGLVFTGPLTINTGRSIAWSPESKALLMKVFWWMEMAGIKSLGLLVCAAGFLLSRRALAERMAPATASP